MVYKVSKALASTGKSHIVGDTSAHNAHWKVGISDIQARKGTHSKAVIWHHRIGHAPLDRINHAIGLSKPKIDKAEVCWTFPLAKFIKQPYISRASLVQLSLFSSITWTLGVHINWIQGKELDSSLLLSMTTQGKHGFIKWTSSLKHWVWTRNLFSLPWHILRQA